jgi:hypothetical protein
MRPGLMRSWMEAVVKGGADHHDGRRNRRVDAGGVITAVVNAASEQGRWPPEGAWGFRE